MNRITLAPSIADVSSAYQRWAQSYVGSPGDFFVFMTKPSADRTAFMMTIDARHDTSDRFITNEIPAL